MQNYQKVAQAWANYSWIDSDVASFVQSHYGGYSVEVVDGLKIIALQTDAWYYFNCKWKKSITQLTELTELIRF